jgi:hypothetical protein
MWISKERWEKLQDELQLLRTKVQVHEAVEALRQSHPQPTILPAPPPLKEQSSKPIDEEKTRRIRDLLDGSKGTKWQKYKRQMEQSLRSSAPTEITVNTPATQEK